jgi:hypothetical protein
LKVDPEVSTTLTPLKLANLTPGISDEGERTDPSDETDCLRLGTRLPTPDGVNPSDPLHPFALLSEMPVSAETLVFKKRCQARGEVELAHTQSEPQT